MHKLNTRAMAIKCHSGFIHYNMYHNTHCHGGGDNFGSIFNITNNCKGNHTGFWGGLGAGIGFGLGGMLSGMLGGLMGGFGNIFGGFGMGGFGLGSFGMGSFGMGSFGNMFGGFGNGLSSLWGGSSNTSEDYSDYASRRSSRKSSREKDDNKLDVDNQKFAKITTLIAELKPGEVTDEKYNEIKAELDKALKATDGIQREHDEVTYKKLLNTLNNLRGDGIVNKAAPLGVDPDADLTPPKGDVTPKDTILNIGGKDIPLKNLTPSEIDKLSETQINGLKPEEAKQLLETLGLLCKGNADGDGVHATTNLNALRLTKQAGLPLACGHNTKLDAYESKGALPYLRGMISNIKYDEATKTITFALEDCKAEYEMKCEADSSTITLVKETKNKDNNYEEADKNIDYEIDLTDTDPYAIRNGKAAKKRKTS